MMRFLVLTTILLSINSEAVNIGKKIPLHKKLKQVNLCDFGQKDDDGYSANDLAEQLRKKAAQKSSQSSEIGSLQGFKGYRECTFFELKTDGELVSPKDESSNLIPYNWDPDIFDLVIWDCCPGYAFIRSICRLFCKIKPKKS